MKKFLLALLLGCAITGLFRPPDCPAPLVWRPGEGWTYERFGLTSGRDPKEQLEMAKAWHEQGEYSNAVAAYRRLISRWPTSFAVEEARFGMAESLSALGYHWKAFKEYQALIEKHPNSDNFETALQRQFEIGNLFYAGERHKAWGIRWFPSLDKALDIYQQVVKNGPYSPVGAQAQFRIGLTYEKQKEYISAVRAYERLIERYPRNPLAETAQFQIGYAYQQEAKRAEYDQNAANQAIAAYTDFLVRYPNSDKVPAAEEARVALKEEQSRGLFQVGQFYEHAKEYKAALIYYNDVIEQNPRSDWATAAKQKVAALTPRLEPAEARATP